MIRLFKRLLFGDKVEKIARGSKVPVILTKKFEGKAKAVLQKFLATRKVQL